jgi:hypothetical protein
MVNIAIFYDHLEYFGIVCGHLVYFLRFGMFGPRKIWQPCFGSVKQPAMTVDFKAF